MRRLGAAAAEVVHGLDDAAFEIVPQGAVDEHAGRQRMIWTGQPGGQRRALIAGRPSLGGSCSKSLIRTHWGSTRNGFEAILNSAVLGRRRGGHFDREMTM